MKGFRLLFFSFLHLSFKFVIYALHISFTLHRGLLYNRRDEQWNTFTTLPERKRIHLWLLFMQSDRVKLVLHH